MIFSLSETKAFRVKSGRFPVYIAVMIPFTATFFGLSAPFFMKRLKFAGKNGIMISVKPKFRMKQTESKGKCNENITGI